MSQVGELALSVKGLCSWYGKVQALWDVTFTLARGEGLGIIGRNGAGKSTLLRSISGIQDRTSGAVLLGGMDVSRWQPFEMARLGLSLVRENAPVFTQLSVLENIQLGAVLARRRGRAPLEMGEVWSVFPALHPFTEKQAGLLSGGQRQMLALATALISRPSVLLLDEPSAGLAPEAAAGVFSAIGGLRAAGVTLLIAEQNQEWVAGVATRVIQLERGRVGC